jgi:hypothetical protein
LMQGYILFYNQSFIITKRKMQMMHTNFWCDPFFFQWKHIAWIAAILFRADMQYM